MKTWDILSPASDGKLVAVCSVEAASAEEAIQLTSNFCEMMDCPAHSAVPQS